MQNACSAVLGNHSKECAIGIPAALTEVGDGIVVGTHNDKDGCCWSFGVHLNEKFLLH